MGTAQAPEPDAPGLAEELRLALLDGAPTDLTGAAVTLLTDLPGAVYRDPALARYITAEQVGGKRLATVDWTALGLDLLSGAMLHLNRSHRALLLIAASIGAGGGVPIRLGAVLPECRDDINLLIGALQHAGGVW